MSSLFTVAETEVARLALARLDGDGFDVAGGGLGLGYTAQAVLADPRVHDLVVIDLLEPVMEWHRHGLLPLGRAIAADPRCRLVHGDFFAMVEGAGWILPPWAGPSTPSSSTSTTPPGTCWPKPTVRSTAPPAAPREARPGPRSVRTQ